MLADVCHSGKYSAGNIAELAGNAFNKVAVFTALSVTFAICGGSLRPAEHTSDSDAADA